MKKFKSVCKKVGSKFGAGAFTSLALMVIATSQTVNSACIFLFLGQDDMPEELL